MLDVEGVLYGAVELARCSRFWGAEEAQLLGRICCHRIAAGV